MTFPLSAQYYTVFPIAKRAEAAARGYLRQQVRDPVVRDKLTPRYAVGCKRPGFHNTYLFCRRSTATTSRWSPSPSRRSPDRVW